MDPGWGPKADTRFSPSELAAFSRVFARNAALRLGTEGAGLVAAASTDGAGLTAALGLERLVGAQAGLLDDMDRVADAIYDRTD